VHDTCQVSRAHPGWRTGRSARQRAPPSWRLAHGTFVSRLLHLPAGGTPRAPARGPARTTAPALRRRGARCGRDRVRAPSPAGQLPCLRNQVAHVHWHVTPRYADDPLPSLPIWSRVPADRRVVPRSPGVTWRLRGGGQDDRAAGRSRRRL